MCIFGGMRIVGFLAVVALTACGSSASTRGAGGASSATSTTTASSTSSTASTGTGGSNPAPPPLEIIPNHGGPVVATPEVITVTWSGDSIGTGLEAFDKWFDASSVWKTIMAEWGVGPGTWSTHLTITDPAPATLDDADIQSLLVAQIGKAAVPPPNGSRVYMVYPPEGVVVTQGGYAGCSTFQAYHSSFSTTVGGASGLAMYAVTPRCANTQGLPALDYITWGASHELMEACSDPDYLHPAWRIDTQTASTPVLGENADLCTGNATVVEGHVITRNYSNVAAMNGERPCVPSTGPQFGLYANPIDITIAPGADLTVPVYAFATGPMSAFNVAVRSEVPGLTAALGSTMASNGDALMLTLHADATLNLSFSNLVDLYAYADHYQIRYPIVVHKGK